MTQKIDTDMIDILIKKVCCIDTNLLQLRMSYDRLVQENAELYDLLEVLKRNVREDK